MATIRYLGHAGFVVEKGEHRLLMDPWFHPAFLASWFPYPDNRSLLPSVVDGLYDHLWISHFHEDHFDVELLRRLDKDITVVLADYRSRSLPKAFAEMGFRDVVTLGHKESLELAPGFTATMYLDTSHKEDSGLLLDLDGFRFLDLNDCNTPMSELPTDVDLLAAQFSGAMWYPNCYDYPPAVMQEKVDGVRGDLLDTLRRKIHLTGASAYLPSAGPACFLDPELAIYNDRDTTIFPSWEQVADKVVEACPGVEVMRLGPGDTMLVDVEARAITAQRSPASRLDEDLDAYRERRRDEWEAYHAGPEPEITQAELDEYFGTLQRRNRQFLGDFTKDVRLTAGSTDWDIRLGKLAQDLVIESEEPFDPDYTLLVPPRALRAILDGTCGWEEALLSMRCGLHRDPDVFDLTFMGLLRYGSHPVQTMQMLRERNNDATIERDGLRLQRFCPHAGEDLTYADIADGRIECPRHHWIWDARTGACIDKASVPLRVEVLDEESPVLIRRTADSNPTVGGGPA